MKKLIKVLMAGFFLLLLGVGLKPAVSVHAEEITYHKSFEAAAAELGKGMAARQTTVSVGLNFNLAMQLVDQEAATETIKNMYQMALNHTGNPKEGDYIKWQYDYNNITMDYSMPNETIVRGVVLTFHLSYYSTAEQEAELDGMIEELLDELGVRQMSSNYEKIKAIYDFMCDNISLDREHQNNSGYTLQYTAYAALKNKSAACRGFSSLLYRLALELGIDSRIVMGTTGGQLHTWNIVQMDDGLYYNLDATYDSSLNMHQCFLKSDGNMPNHVRQDEYKTEEFYSEYPTGETNYSHEENVTQEPEEVPFAISGASLTLHNALSINYKVNSKLFTEEGYSDPYIVFEMNGEKITVNRYTEDNGYYLFTYVNIAPHQMNDIILSTLYATRDGAECASETREYSVAAYCYTMLDKCSPENDPENQYDEFRTLLVDLLHYGSKAQNYTNHNLDHPVDEKLTDLQKSWATAGNRTLVDAANRKYKEIENPSVIWKGAGLTLKDSITMRFIIQAEDIEGLKLVITSDAGNWTIPAKQFVKDNESGFYVIHFAGLNAAQLSEVVYATIYDGDTPVSHTVSYSVESYAYSKIDSDDSLLVELLNAMMNYGDSAKAYVENN